MSEFALKLAEEQIVVLREALLESEAENAKIKRGSKDMDFLLAKAYDLLEKASGKKDELGAESQIWCMQYEDALLTGDQDG